MDEMKSAHLRNLPKAGLTTCSFENCVTLTEKSKRRRLYSGTDVWPYEVSRMSDETDTHAGMIDILYCSTRVRVL